MLISELDVWGGFYSIVGSAAATLIGLQFVVMTLIAARPPARAEEASAAFGSPTTVHFGVTLFLAAVLHAPWPGIEGAALLWGVTGIVGIVYEVLVGRRLKKQTAYKPVFEDWLFHFCLPLVAYLILAGSAVVAVMHFYVREILFSVAAATLVLLLSAIHNAWDAVAYHVVSKSQERHAVGLRANAETKLSDERMN